MKVKCISDLGQTYDGEIIEDNITPSKEEMSWFKQCSGRNRYAKVLDLEFKDTSTRKWGYDLFTEAQYKKLFKS